jgi:BirA family biotin operon repressor/biotin-[acetyl-CoA-carboxylase] ligase
MLGDVNAFLAKYLEPLQLGGWLYFPELGSTNDRALQWAQEGATDLSLVVADFQTQGRGRNGRQWVTKPGTSLAVSVIFRPTYLEEMHITRFTALAALGLIETLQKFGCQSEIKWPNDVLLGGKKVAGVLVEGDWEGDRLNALVVGMGVNITADAVQNLADLRYPATSVESILGASVNRWEILQGVVQSMQSLRKIIFKDEFLNQWNAHLAFRGQRVSFKVNSQPARVVKIIGVTGDGRLEVENIHGEKSAMIAGEIVMNK